MRYLFAIFTLVLFPCCLMSQELNAKVAINTSQIGNTNTEACRILQEKVQEFLNNKQWTPIHFNEVERTTSMLWSWVRVMALTFFTPPMSQEIRSMP